MDFKEIIQNLVDDAYKRCITRPTVKFNMAVLGYDNNHTLYEYYVYFGEKVYDIISVLWDISEQRIESINSLRG